MRQFRRWKRLWRSSLTRSHKRTSIEPWRSCRSGTTNALKPEGTRVSCVCYQYKCPYEKSLQTYLMILVKAFTHIHLYIYIYIYIYMFNLAIHLTHQALVIRTVGSMWKLKITDIFLSNRSSRISKFNSTKSFGLSKCSIYVKILWIGAASQLFADNISGSVMHRFKVRIIFAIRPAFLSS